MNASAILKGRNLNKVEEKPMIQFIKPVDEVIKTKLYSISNKGYSATQPKIITIEEIKKSIAEWKLENQIFSQEITLANCTELSLSFQKILQIANLENLVKLEKLKLDNNMIMKIENLDALVNIKWLDLSFNAITKIEGLDNLSNLEDLSVYNNQITQVEGLDNCRKLNVLSIGRNNIKTPKEMVSYLRKFNNLKALNIHDNPFCREDTTMQMSLEQHLQQKSIYYPSSYDPILANLEHLKYLDWKPIDEDKRQIAIHNYKNSNQKDRNDTFQQNEEKQQRLMKEFTDMKHANAEAVIDFYKQVEKRIKDDTTVQGGWEKLRKVPGLEDKLKLLEKLIEDTVVSYKTDILSLQTDKDRIIRQKTKEIEMGQEKFVEQSKELISVFKREFKKNTLNIKPEHINKDKIESEIKALTDKLLEIEIYEKQQMTTTLIKNFQNELKSVNEKMSDRTNKLKEELDLHKKTFKEALTNLQNELSTKADAYHDENSEIPKTSELDEIYDLVEDPDVNGDIEKMTDIYDDKITALVCLR